MASSKVTKDRNANDRKASYDLGTLERHTWRNWFMLSGIAVLITVGLALIMSFVLWPWSGADVTLLIGLVLAVFMLIVDLTQEQRRTFNTRRQMQKLQSSSTEYRYNRLYELLTVTRLLDSEGDPESVFVSIPNMCLQIFNCEKASLMLYNEDNRSLEVQSAAGYSDCKIIGARQKVGDGIAGWVAKYRKPVVLQEHTDLKQYPGLRFIPRGVAAAIVVPVLFNNKLLGVLSMSTRSAKIYYDGEDLRALEAFAENVAVCIGNVLRTREMKQTIAKQKHKLEKLSPSTILL